MIIDELNLEIRIVKTEDNLITINFNSDNKLKLLVKDIKIIDAENKTNWDDCSIYGVIDVVLNNSQTNKTIEFKSNIYNYETISFIIKNRMTCEKYPVKLKLH